jgi:hypothetical protein
MAINTGDLLMGLGAAVGGTGPQFIQGLEQRDRQATEQKRAELQARQQAMYQDAATGLQLFRKGDLDGLIALGEDRLQLLQTYPDADPSDTQRIIQLARFSKQGDPVAQRNLAMELTTATARGISMGLVQMPEAQKPEIIPSSSVVNGQIITQDAMGNLVAQIPEGFTPTPAETPETFRVLTPKEVAQYQLDPGSYKINNKTQEVTRIGAPTTTVNIGEGGQSPEFSKMIDQQFAGFLNAASTSASARPQLEMLTQLAPLTTQGQIPAQISRLFPTFNDANAAFIGITNQVLPSLRVPGSGAQSDKDIDVLLNSIGSLSASAEVKQLMLQSLIQKDEINQQLADITEEYAANTITRAEAIKRTRAINSRSIIAPELQMALREVAGLPKAAKEANLTVDEWNRMTAAEKDQFK